MAETKTESANTKFGIAEALLFDPKYGKPNQKGGLWEVVQLLKAGNTAAADDLFYKTEWYKLDDDFKKNYLLNLDNQDLYKERLKEFVTRIRKTLRREGLKATDEQLKDYFDRGIDEDIIFDELAGGIRAKGAAGQAADALDTLRTTARANGFNLEKDFGNQLDSWLQRISRGESVDDFSRIIRSQAKLGLPEKVGTLLDEGLDLANIYAPYRNTMASLLEMTPDAINLDDSLLRSAYGMDKEMSIYDFKRAVRKDPRWQYTDNAREEVSTAALGILRDFGFQG